MLEHGLRVLYAQENECPEKVVTANPDTFYTTLDEILARTTESGDKNGVIEVLGVPLLELLRDLFMVQTGPRLRDRVSHGEADPSSFGDTLVTVYVAALTSLAFRFRGTAVRDQELSPDIVSLLLQAEIPAVGDEDNDLRCNEYVDHYVAVYHPLSQAKEAASQFMSLVSDLADFLQTHPEMVPNAFTLSAFQASTQGESILQAASALKATFDQV